MQKQVHLPSSLLIDPKSEPLQTILPSYGGVKHVPSELSGPGQMVFVELNKCFQQAGHVSEGLLPNLIWGFEQCGYDPRHVAAGLTNLRAKGYLFYSDAGRLPHSELLLTTDKSVQIWVRYTKKFLDLITTKTLVEK